MNPTTSHRAVKLCLVLQLWFQRHDVSSYSQQNHQKFMLCACSGLKIQSAEERTGQMATSQSGPHVSRHTCACAHINTHNYRNVSRRSGCQGSPLRWPAVAAAAGRVVLFQRTTRRVVLLPRNRNGTRTVTSRDHHYKQTFPFPDLPPLGPGGARDACRPRSAPVKASSEGRGHRRRV